MSGLLVGLISECCAPASNSVWLVLGFQCGSFRDFSFLNGKYGKQAKKGTEAGFFEVTCLKFHNNIIIYY